MSDTGNYAEEKAAEPAPAEQTVTPPPPATTELKTQGREELIKILIENPNVDFLYLEHLSDVAPAVFGEKKVDEAKSINKTIDLAFELQDEAKNQLVDLLYLSGKNPSIDKQISDLDVEDVIKVPPEIKDTVVGLKAQYINQTKIIDNSDELLRSIDITVNYGEASYQIRLGDIRALNGDGNYSFKEITSGLPNFDRANLAVDVLQEYVNQKFGGDMDKFAGYVASIS